LGRIIGATAWLFALPFPFPRLPTMKPLQEECLVSTTRTPDRAYAVMKLLTRTGYLVEDQGITYMAENDADSAMTPLHSTACT
jgi:hypothetical protein